MDTGYLLFYTVRWSTKNLITERALRPYPKSRPIDKQIKVAHAQTEFDSSLRGKENKQVSQTFFDPLIEILKQLGSGLRTGRLDLVADYHLDCYIVTRVAPFILHNRKEK